MKIKLSRKQKVSLGVVLVSAMLLGVGISYWKHKKASAPILPVARPRTVANDLMPPPEPPTLYHYQTGPISIETMKNKGCVADGLLSGYGKDTNAEVAMIQRSGCSYLHRALETWGSPPDFNKAAEIMQKINKPGLIYGMFIAEDLRTSADYSYADSDGDLKQFNFSAMCCSGSQNAWGEHTCKPDLDNRQYREYVTYIMERGIDLGIQSFMFGQIYYQDDPNLSQSKLYQVLDTVRAYAQKKGVQIVIGAQTGNITDEKYLQQFDYIEGGVGIGDSGTIENGPCWSQLSSCWALLWNQQYASKAKNVCLALDWSGLQFDDMSSFARMDKDKRMSVIQKLYTYFTSKNMGFMLPMMATLNKANGGCYGAKKGFYSASNQYSCGDEGVINSILNKNAG